MASRVLSKMYVPVICVFALLIVFTAADQSFGQTLNMSPHKIVLNAQGQAVDFQGVIGMSMESGYRLTGFDVTLSFDGVEICEAITFQYCPIDNNFLAGFDRMEVLNSPTVQSMAGRTVEATISGSYDAVDADGNTKTIHFECSDSVEIIDPEKKP